MKKIGQPPKEEIIPEDEEPEEVEETEVGEETEEVEELEEMISEKVQYWLHTPSNKVAITEEGDDVSEMVFNDDIEEITKLKYTKLKNKES